MKYWIGTVAKVLDAAIRGIHPSSQYHLPLDLLKPFLEYSVVRDDTVPCISSDMYRIQY
jgi:hypothetical protein